MPKGVWVPLTLEQEEFMRENYLELPVKRIAAIISISHGRVQRFLDNNELIIPKEIVEQRKIAGQRKPGDIPFNKGLKQFEYMSEDKIERVRQTCFKKGNLPHNTKYDGHERISKDGYVEVRISKANYRLKHIVEWEKINGKLPSGHCLLCQDGDKTNTSPENWKLISRAENMYRNSKKNYPKEIIPTMVLVNQINKSIKNHENGKGKAE